jgi:DNA sulfur modification protein DndC
VKQSRLGENITGFTDPLLTLPQSINLTIKSIVAHAHRYPVWLLMYSMGKDSSTLVTLLAWLKSVADGYEMKPEWLEGVERIVWPERIIAVNCDTKMENPALLDCARAIISELGEVGIETIIVQPKLEHRFFVYMLGRGIPPPHNRFRWCTDKLKVEPPKRIIEQLYEQCQQKLLVMTGVRVGESAARDERIIVSCSRDGGECGQGRFQESFDAGKVDALDPLLHWRPCNIWAWLGAQTATHGFSTRLIGEAYGGEDAESINTRTGCLRCRLVTEDRSLETVLKIPRWSYLAPIRRLTHVYDRLALPSSRLRHTGYTVKGNYDKRRANQLGPLTMEARRYGLETVLAIQSEVNASGPAISLIDNEEREHIEFLIENDTWPDGWTGREPRGDEPYEKIYEKGAQALLYSITG